MLALTNLRHLLRRAPVSKGTPTHLRERYRGLLEAPVIEHDDGGRSVGDGRLWRVGGLNVLGLRGDRFEMAYQHGRLLSDEIQEGTLAMASRITPDAIRCSVGEGLVAKALSWYARRAISDPMLAAGVAQANVRNPGEDHLVDAYGLSAGCGVPVDVIIQAALGPETAQTLLGKTSALVVGSNPNQCTSFVAWGDATRDGQLLIGRNTDYPLVGYYDAHPTVLYCEPTDAPRPYMTVTSAGFHNAGVCGLNDAGLYLAVHTVPAATVSEFGAPVFMVGQQILRTCSTFDEAAAALESYNSAAGWNYHLVSTRERRAATFEISSDRVSRLDVTSDRHVTTNHWRNPEMTPFHLFVNNNVEEDSRARMQRAFDLIDAAEGDLDEVSAAAILGDAYDPVNQRPRIVPNVIASPHTVSSSVWSTDEDRVYVATGRAPSSRSEYVQLPTISAFDPETFAADRPSMTPELTPADDPARSEALALFIEAKCAIEYEDDAERAADLMDRAVAADDRDESLQIVRGMLAIRAGRPQVAEDALRAVLDCSEPRRVDQARYLLGRVLADQGRTDEARTLLQAVVAHAEGRIVDAARVSLRKLRWRRRLPLGRRDISPMVFLADAFRYSAVL